LRAAVLRAVGEPPAVEEVPVPERGPGEALVRIEAAALNPVELHISHGRFFEGPPRLPYIPGVEAAGVVEEGDSLRPGTHVRIEFVHPGYGRDGAVAEYAVAPESPDDSDRRSQAMVFPLPEGVGFVDGAALGSSAYTALMLFDRAAAAGARIEGATVLVVAATGALGRCVVQIARKLGAARVVAAGRDAKALERTLELGADVAVSLGGDPATHASGSADDGDLRRRLADAAGHNGFDLALEPLWGEPARAAIETLGAGGVLVNYGQVAAATAEIPSLPLRNPGVTLVGHSGAWTTPAQRRDGFERVQELGLTMDVEELALDAIAHGWRRLAGSGHGKLVVRMGDA
jgi:NADPH:quinone reductase-like Zn-dependent oxidoreductase